MFVSNDGYINTHCFNGGWNPKPVESPIFVVFWLVELVKRCFPNPSDSQPSRAQPAIKAFSGDLRGWRLIREKMGEKSEDR